MDMDMKRAMVLAYTSAWGAIAGTAQAQCDPAVLFTQVQQFIAGGAPNNVALRDLNGDGVLDVVVATLASVSVLLGQGDGSFGPTQSIPTGGTSTSIGLAIGDLNGDGILDIVSTNIVFPSFTPIVSVLLGNGDGTFGVPQQFETMDPGTFPLSVVIADFDGDGVQDLGVAHDLGSISVLSGTGNGSFQLSLNVVVGQSLNSIATADFNRDGRPDIVVTDFSTGTARVLLRSVSNGFWESQAISTGDGPVSVATSDFDGDDLIDLAVVNSVSDTVTVLRGLGDGTFLDFGSYATGEGPRSVAIGDIDGDGTLDLAVTNRDGDSVSVFRGFGDTTFRPKQDFGVSDAPFSIATGDLNGDGLLDLIATRSPNGIDVLLNQCGVSGPCNAADIAEPFGVLDVFDLFEFLGSYQAQDAIADWDDDGVFTVFDVFAYIASYAAGCP